MINLKENKTHFKNAADEVLESYQLLRDNQACVVIDLRNGKVERFETSKDCVEIGKNYLEKVLKAQLWTLFKD